jgi:hypothetical protein
MPRYPLARPILDILQDIERSAYDVDDSLEYPETVRDATAHIRRLVRQARDAHLEQRKRDRDFYLAQRRAG